MGMTAMALAMALAILALGCGQQSKPEKKGAGAAKQAAAPAQSAASPASVSARYYAVQKHLDQGGSFYLYADLKDALRDLVGKLRKTAGQPGMPPMASAIVQVADQEIDRLGVYGVQGVGMSSLPEADGMFLNKFFLAVPEAARKGVWALLGGPAHPIDYLKMAPEDTLVFKEGELDADGALMLLKQVVMDTAGVFGAQRINAAFDQAKARTGVDWNEVMHSLSGKFVFMAMLDANKKMTIPTDSAAGKPFSMEAPLGLVAIGVKDAKLYEGLHRLAEQAKVAEPETVNGAMRQFKIKTPPNPVMEITAVVAHDGAYCYVATDQGYMERVLGNAAGGRNLADAQEFKDASRGMTLEGNGIAFVSRRVPEYVRQFIQGVQAAQSPASFVDRAANMALQQAIQSLGGEPAAAFMIRRNLPDGIEVVSRSRQGARQVLAAALAAPAAVLAAIAVPNFIEAQTRSKVARAQTDMRTMAVALESYHIDFNAYPTQDKLTCLTTPISYLTQLMDDPFAPAKGTIYSYWIDPTRKGWILWSAGPDKRYDLTTQNIGELYNPAVAVPSAGLIEKTFDPTNGTVSPGDVYRYKQ
jgi:type II secretory pathway pseudopilin PulG